MGGLRTVLPLVIAGGCHFATPEPVKDGPRAIDAASDAPGFGCPSSYVALTGQTHRYRFMAVASDWTTQKAACTFDAPQSYLAIPDSAAELQALDDYIANPTEYWVGISDSMFDGAYLTVKNQPQMFLPWAMGEPAPEPPPTDCVKVLTQGGLFATEVCATSLAAVCECEPAPG